MAHPDDIVRSTIPSIFKSVVVQSISLSGRRVLSPCPVVIGGAVRTRSTHYRTPQPRRLAVRDNSAKAVRGLSSTRLGRHSSPCWPLSAGVMAVKHLVHPLPNTNRAVERLGIGVRADRLNFLEASPPTAASIITSATLFYDTRPPRKQYQPQAQLPGVPGRRHFPRSAPTTSGVCSCGTPRTSFGARSSF